jgi:hypothetical protein
VPQPPGGRPPARRRRRAGGRCRGRPPTPGRRVPLPRDSSGRGAAPGATLLPPAPSTAHRRYSSTTRPFLDQQSLWHAAVAKAERLLPRQLERRPRAGAERKRQRRRAGREARAGRRERARDRRARRVPGLGRGVRTGRVGGAPGRQAAVAAAACPPALKRHGPRRPRAVRPAPPPLPQRQSRPASLERVDDGVAAVLDRQLQRRRVGAQVAHVGVEAPRQQPGNNVGVAVRRGFVEQRRAARRRRGGSDDEAGPAAAVGRKTGGGRALGLGTPSSATECRQLPAAPRPAASRSLPTGPACWPVG